MERIAFSNNKGMSLIELLISLVILSIVSLALMRTTLVGISENMRTTLRDEATSLADQRMNELHNMTNNDVMAAPAVTTVTRDFRAGSVTFTLNKSYKTIIDTSTLKITILVTWKYHGQSFSHTVTTIKRTQVG